jgi:type IV secretion/conjugal transfer VirB4 family ATPase
MLFREFKYLPRKRERLLGFSDLLNYAALVDSGVILLKDGSLLAGWRYTGPDLNSAGAEELTALSHQVNSALAALGDGWAMNVDLIRHPSAGYPDRGAFPDPVTALIDEERRRHHTAEGRHFESALALTLTWTPPTEMQSRAAGLIFESTARRTNWEQTLEFFKRSLGESEDALSARLALARMDDATLLAHLNACITGRREPIRPPEDGSYLDVLLGCHELHAGFRPMLDDLHIRVVSIVGFPLASWPEVTAFLDEQAIPYRWSTRFIFLDPAEAERALKIQRRNWFQKRHGLGGMIKQVFSNGAAQSFENRDAVAMAHDADEALAEATSCRVRFGYYTGAIIATDEDAAVADANAREIAKQLQHHGFPALIEHVNANEAWFGSLPGHGYRNVRRPLVHTRNLADLIPTTSVWAGEETNPCPFYPENSAPLIHAATTGSTPFRLNLHVGDVGHTLIFGPTGSGKSTLLGLLIAQFFRYPEAQVFCFDKGLSAFVLAAAAGGRHYDLGESEIAFCPLARVDDESERTWAVEWLEMLLALQGVAILPQHRKALWRALELLGESQPDARTVTDLIRLLQDQTLRDGLNFYSVHGPMGRFLDADRDGIEESRFITFEIEALMAMGEKVLLPVLTYLFHRIDGRLDGRPTLLVLDEAWVMLANGTFGAKVEEWLRTLRKKNAAVVLATQSLTEVANSPVRDVILESCPTKILLSNPEAQNPATSELYRKFGLTDRQIEIIAEAVPKRHYYYLSPLGRRLFELALGPATLAFIGAGSKAEILEARRLIAAHRRSWPIEWLRTRGQIEWAEQLAKSYGPAEPPLRELTTRNGHLNGGYFNQANGAGITPNEGANKHGTIP